MEGRGVTRAEMRARLKEEYAEAYELMDDGWLVRAKGGSWLALDAAGGIVYGREAKVVRPRKKQAISAGEIFDGDSEEVQSGVPPPGRGWVESGTICRCCCRGW